MYVVFSLLFELFYSYTLQVICATVQVFFRPEDKWHVRAKY